MVSQSKFLGLELPSSWFWPVALMSVLLLTHGGKKCYIIGMSCYHLVSQQDKRCALPSYDPGKLDMDKVVSKQRKQLIAIRHAESTWNELFNRSLDWRWPFRLVHTVALECVLFVTSDSMFVDAPLSELGISQARKLQEYLFDEDPSTKSTGTRELTDVLSNSEKGTTLLISSPLRRCIETITIGLFPRLNKSKEKILLVSNLQELTGNVDGISLCGKAQLPPLSTTIRSYEANESHSRDWKQWFSLRLDATFKQGFKPSIIRGDSRLKAFAEWLFSTDSGDYEKVVMSGHSLWFRQFFAAFLPRNSTHPAKSCKIKNAGAIAFDFVQYKMSDGTTRYGIEPDSVIVVYGGFESSSNRRG